MNFLDLPVQADSNTEILPGLEMIHYQSQDLPLKLAGHFERIIELGKKRNILAGRFFKAKDVVKEFDAIDKLIKDEVGIGIRHYETIQTWYATYCSTTDFNGMLNPHASEIYDWVVDYVNDNPKVCDTKNVDTECGMNTVFADMVDTINKTRDNLFKGVTIDLKHAKIKGLEGNITVLCNPWALINAGLTGLELAAVLLHEVGHVFTGLEYSVQQHTKMISLEDKLKSHTGTLEEKLTIIAEETGSRKSEKSGVLGVIETIGNYVDSRDREVKKLDTAATANSIGEELADTFAGQFGVGVELASGLNKLEDRGPLINRIGGMVVSAMASSLWIIMYSVLVGSFSLILPVIIIIAILTLLLETLMGGFIDQGDTTYPSKYDRYKDISLNILNIIKTTDLTKEDKKKFLKDYDLVVGIMKASKNPVLDPIFNWVINSKDKRESKIFYDQIENLMNNPLILAKTRLETIG